MAYSFKEILSEGLLDSKYILYIMGYYIECIYIYIFFNKFIYYLFSFGCVGSSFLCEGFLQLRQAGATLHRGARASHCHGLSCCGARAPDAPAQ